MMDSSLWEGYQWDTSVWDRLKTCGKPIALYGMGLGAEKILQTFEIYGIHPSAVFASDGFVRGHSFHGFPVLDYETLCEKFSDCVVVISFASQRPEVLEQMKRVSERFETVAPDVPVAGEILFTPELIKSRRPEWEAAYSLLADNWSRFVFREVLQFKLTGRIEHLFRCESPRRDIWELLSLREDEFLVDMGAYTGDTIKEFLEQTKFQCRKILALEPDSRSFRKLSLCAQELQKSTSLTFGAKISAHGIDRNSLCSSGRLGEILPCPSLPRRVWSIERLRKSQWGWIPSTIFCSRKAFPLPC